MGKQRRPGGQPKNSNAVRHGRFKRSRLDGRKLAVAQVKALAHLAHALGLLPGRCRARKLRPDQFALLLAQRPEIVRLIEVVGVRA